MKDVMLGYYRPNSDDFTELWEKGTFVLDANVLLNMYSYAEGTQEIFFAVLEKIRDRLWVPHHVALEFERNRINRIRQSNQRVEKLLDKVQSTSRELQSEVDAIELSKRNIGTDDLPNLLEAVKTAHEGLSEAVRSAIARLPSISLDDPIRDRISGLLSGRIGEAPKSQAELDQLLSDAEDRFEKRIPPGFADVAKGDGTFRDRGIDYARKYGDLILWKQILNHAAATNTAALILVTEDRKADWWWRDGERTLGPLPELTQEIALTGKVQKFWMYSAPQFLEHAQNYLKAEEVTADAVKDVAAAATTNELADASTASSVVQHRWRRQRPVTAREAVPHHVVAAFVRWLKKEAPHSVTEVSDGFPMVKCLTGNNYVGYELVSISTQSTLPYSALLAAARARMANSEYDRMTLVLVLGSESVPAFLTNDHDSVEFLSLLSDLPSAEGVSDVMVGFVKHESFFVLATLPNVDGALPARLPARERNPF